MCSCIFLAPAIEDYCDVFVGWHITKGHMGNVDLKGLNAALVVHAPKQMTDGGWKLALYTDERANKDPQRGRGRIYDQPCANIGYEIAGHSLRVRRSRDASPKV